MRISFDAATTLMFKPMCCVGPDLRTQIQFTKESITMLHTKHYLFLVAILLVGVASPLGAQLSAKSNAATASAAAQPQLSTITVDARVVNTPNVNVVNTPTVNVGNVPMVNLASGTAVSLVGTPAVQVSNTAANPIFVKDPAVRTRQPIRLQDKIRVSLPTATSDTFTDFNGYVVPQGKRLVIEYVNAFVPSGTNDMLLGQFVLIPTTIPAPGLVSKFPWYTFAGQGGYLTGNQVLIFLDAGFGLDFVAEVPPNLYGNGTVDFTVTLSGYLEDAP
jgi:hypothetical protein